MKRQTKTRVRSNDQIRAKEVRLIAEDGEQLGVLSLEDAIKRAEDDGLDVVEVAGNVAPPVCRLMDVGKYLYSLDKKEKEARKKQKTISVKEIKLSCKIEKHDYETKLRNAKKFLERGDKVKLTMFFRGREITHKDIGEKMIARFIEDISDVGGVERNDGLDGRSILVYFAPLSMLGKKAITNENKETKNEGTEVKN